jgi:hypothetical protein
MGHECVPHGGPIKGVREREEYWGVKRVEVCYIWGQHKGTQWTEKGEGEEREEEMEI